jgi:hypothetical protein
MRRKQILGEGKMNKRKMDEEDRGPMHPKHINGKSS